MIDQTEGYTNSDRSPGFEITSVSRRCSSCKNTTIGQQFCNRKRQESGHGVRLFLTSRSTNSVLSWEWESRFKTALLHWDCYSLVPVSGRVFSWQYSGGKGKRSLLSAPSLDFLLQKCCSVLKKKKKSPPTLLQHRCHIVNQCLRGAGARDAACDGLETFFLSPVQVIYRRIFEDKKIYFKWSV